MRIDCVICGKKNLEKNAVGINKKLLGEKVNNYYCIDCLADYLGVSIDEILEKIEEFKEEGCILFD